MCDHGSLTYTRDSSCVEERISTAWPWYICILLITNRLRSYILELQPSVIN